MNETIIRTAVLVVALVNQVLLVMGKDILPWSESAIGEGISCLVTVVATAWSWWKNNSVTKEAIQADEYLDTLKNGED